MNNKYNIGDFIYIGSVPKWGVIYDVEYERTCRYLIYWIYKDGSSESVKASEYSVNHWITEEAKIRFGNKILTNQNE